MKSLLCAFLCVGIAAVGHADDSWVKPMQKVHKGFKGNSGYVAQLGDSITHSMAFWSMMGWFNPAGQLKDDGLPKNPNGKQWKQVLKGARDKGGKHGNYSGWTVNNLLKVVDKVIAEKKPEVALLMIGTNDVKKGLNEAKYKAGVESIVTKLLNANCVPIISTIPPFRGKDAGVAKANEVVKAIAKAHNIPLVDYHGEIMKRRAKDWDGTLISKDGIHPSGGKTHDWSEGNLNTSGYALRSYLSFMAVREVYFKVLNP